MPTYEYRCTSCGHLFEKVQSFSEPALSTCPVCEGEVRKVFGNVGIVLKGSGFYKNDSRNGRPAAAKSADKAGGDRSEGSSGSGSGAGASSEPSGSSSSQPAAPATTAATTTP